MSPIFLSASLPDPRRDALRYHATADLMAIRECVRALATVVLGRTRLVFGGHPAITPLVRRVAERLDKMSQIRMYQSAFFAGLFPADNAAFADVVTIKAVRKDGPKSLRLMREQMISSESFGAGVFVGGMEGVEEEFEMFRAAHPKAKLLPVASTGAAARLIFEVCATSIGAEQSAMSRLNSSNVYGALFEDLLGLREAGGGRAGGPTTTRRAKKPGRKRR
jgi:hypothetical protein